jgi:hypothetical protein
MRETPAKSPKTAQMRGADRARERWNPQSGGDADAKQCRTPATRTHRVHQHPSHALPPRSQRAA